MDFELEIQNLKRRIKALENPNGFPMYESQIPLAFKESDNIPCTAALEVRLQKLAAYFEKRAKENTRRAEKEEVEVNMFEPCGYYFSGKADSYRRAAEKLKEVLIGPAPAMSGGNLQDPNTISAPEQCQRSTSILYAPVPAETWIVEFFTCGTWIRSRTISQEFPSQEEAEKAIKRWSPSAALRRAVRLFPPLKPKKEMWVIDYRMKGRRLDGSYRPWVRSGDLGVNGRYTSEAEANKAIAANYARDEKKCLERKASRVA